MTRHRRTLAWLAGSLAIPGALAQPVPVPVPASGETPKRETVREFLDSLADSAIAPDPNQIYRKSGVRREVDLGRGWSASLDEQSGSRVDSAVPLPGLASAPARYLSLMFRQPGWLGDALYSRTAVARDTSLSAAWELLPQLALHGEARDQRSSLLEIDAKRRDSGLGLRWQAWPEVSIDTGLHHARIASASGNPGSSTTEGSDSFWRVGALWQPAELRGLTLHSGAERALAPGRSALSASRFELGADYTLQSDNALGAAFAGSKIFWREAPRLGLLSEGHAIDVRAAFKRQIGVEIPDGSPDGAVYGHWRSRSVASEADQLLVLGWRHAWSPAPRWRLQSHVEQAVPIAGPNGVRSFAIGGRLARGAFPDNSFVTDLELIDSDRRDSLYSAIKYTWRIGDDLLAALRLNATHEQPHGDPSVGTTSYKVSAALGWREPEQKRLSVLGRWSIVGVESSEAGASDRRAHIALGGANLVVDESNSTSVRATRRWERDEARSAPNPRATTMAMARWVHEFNPRWSLSAHLARRNDEIDGNAYGIGTELGYRLSSKAVLALGINPRGFSDHELEVDERLARGVTIRLRFSLDAALARWLN